MSATSKRPARWNAAAATTMIAAFTKNASDSATVESMVAYLIAWRLSASAAATRASARSTSADTGCAASRWRRGCPSRCRASRGWPGPEGSGRGHRPRPSNQAATSTPARRSRRRWSRPASRQSLRCSGSPCSAATAATSTSSVVRHTPTAIGMPNSRLSASALPSSSARSQATIAISHRIHSAIDDRLRVIVAARLRQVAARRHAEPHAQRLQQDRHQIRNQDDAEQRVAELRSAGDVGRPIAGIHVADRDKIAGTQKGEESLPRRAAASGSRCSGRPREATEPESAEADSVVMSM